MDKSHHTSGAAIADESDDGPCPYCEGTGGEIINVHLIEQSDMQELEFLP